MKRSVIVWCFLILLAQGYAQKRTGTSISPKASTCASLPYTPTFGHVGDTTDDVKQWIFSTNNDDLWSFQSVPADHNIIVPFFNNPYNSARTSSIYSQCLSLDNTRKYRLKLTFVGNTVGVTHDLKIYWIANANTYSGEETALVGTWADAPYGTSTREFILDAPAETGDYRLVFRGEDISGHSSFYLKDIVLDEIPPYQLNLVGVASPLSKCDLSNQTVSFKIRNSGSQCPAAYDVCYQYSTNEGVSYSAPICQSFTTDLPFDVVQEVVFSGTQTFQSSETVIKAWVSFPGQTTFDTLKNIHIHKTTPRETPYSCSFDDYSIFQDWVIIPKTTQSNATWSADNNGLMRGQAVILTNSVVSDDRLVSGCISLEKDTLYKISFSYNAFSSTTFENLRLYVGTNNSPQNSDISLMDIQEFNNTEARTVSAYFKPTSSGSYFFGFLAYSKASSGGIAINDFTVTTTTPNPAPAYMGFENYDENEQWQTFSYNSTASNWQTTSTSSEVYSGSAALKILSANTPDTNNTWLISKPLSLVAGEEYEILYFRRTLSSSVDEFLNIRVDNRTDIQPLSLSEPLFIDTVKNSTYLSEPQKVYFTPSQTGIYFVTFQYNSPGASVGLCLDDIAIRDNITASETNLSVVALEVSKPSCTFGSNETVNLIIKNRSSYAFSNQVNVFFMVNGKPSTPRTTSIAPYQSITISTSVDMSAAGTYEVRGWISSDINQTKSDDTSTVQQTQKIQAWNVVENPYTMGFESNESRDLWNTFSGSSNYHWNIADNPALANSGNGLAYLSSTGIFLDSVRQYMGSPCFSLGRPNTTTFFVSFLYQAAAANMVNATSVNIYAGTQNTNLNSQLKHRFSTTNSTYKRFYFYYRPAVNGLQYFGIEGISKREAGGLCIDDFVIMDSASASVPDLAMKQIWVASSNNCSLSPDTLYVEVQNNGFFPYENPALEIKFGNQTLPETAIGTILPDTSIVFKLSTLFAHSAFGTDSVRVSLNIPNNRTKTEMSIGAASTKTAPVEIPYTTVFSEADILPWNNLAEPYTYSRSKPFDYWTFNPAPQTSAYFNNGTLREKPGLLASGCISVKPDQPYRLTFRYRTSDSYSPENLSVLRDKVDGTTDTIATYPTLANTTTYAYQSIAFNSSGNGNERIRFFSNYNFAAKGIYINYVSLVPDTSAWPIDIKLVEITSPNTDIGTSDEPYVMINIANVNLRPVANIPIYYTLDGTLYSDVIGTVLNPGQTLPFIFSQRADFSAAKSYELAVFTHVPGDINLSNDTLRRTVIATPIRSTETSVPLKIYPNPATTEVFIQSPKEISSIFIYDLRGQLLREVTVNNTEFHLNTSDFPAGLYLFSCQIGEERVSQRVIIKNNQP